MCWWIQFQLGIKIFQNKAGVHGLIDPDGPVLSCVEVVHGMVKFGSRLPFPLSAVGIKDHAYCR